jgi:pimeloyl-ACP methyl ester carboxylesterase
VSSGAELTSASGFRLSDGAPAWLRRSLAQPGISGYVDIDGNPIHYLGWDWDCRERPALLLVHGFRAHAHWWSFIAPLLLPEYRVAAIDLSGMGDSGHRQSYDDMTSARDIIGFIRHFGLAPAMVIAHSYGGAQLMRAAAAEPRLFARAILVDVYFNFPDQLEEPVVFPPTDVLPIRESRDDLLSRFRLDPPQPCPIEDLVRYIAFHSARESADPAPQGWHWKFDPKLTNHEYRDGPALLEKVRTRVDYIHGEKSILAKGNRAHRIMRSLRNPGRLHTMPGGHHHLMLDQPLELVAALRELLAQ